MTSTTIPDTATTGDEPCASNHRPMFKTLETVSGHRCESFMLGEGGVHECRHGHLIWPEDVPSAAERAQQSEPE